jgi:hypothetical protein
VTDGEFPRLQLRGSAGFSPASLLTSLDEDARTKEVVKERNPLFPAEKGGLKCNRNGCDTATARV